MGVTSALTEKIESLTLGLNGEDDTGGKRGELVALEEKFRDKCWAQKQKHDAKLKGAFERFRNSAERFKGKILQERSSNTATLETLAELEKKAETVFGPPPVVETPLPALHTDTLLSHETAPILKKRVIGKEDVDIAAMIKKLGNSDWVKEGRPFYEANELLCPFCQQATTEAFANSLSEYFDETFEAENKAIDDLATNYKAEANRLEQQIDSIIAAPSSFLDLENLRSEKALLDSKITINLQRLITKKREPSS